MHTAGHGALVMVCIFKRLTAEQYNANLQAIRVKSNITDGKGGAQSTWSFAPYLVGNICSSLSVCRLFKTSFTMCRSNVFLIWSEFACSSSALLVFLLGMKVTSTHRSRARLKTSTSFLHVQSRGSEVYGSSS